ncbi:MAG: regulatory protein RecX [Candidatus Omnitrophica bacterium]|nr:regulatory protein RecX [Candidatus Omnitrophota bacterium]
MATLFSRKTKFSPYAYSLLLLKFRPRSEYEIRKRLIQKKFTPEVTEKTISLLKEKDLVNDQEFTRVWIGSRIKKPFGLRRIQQELKTKGIKEEFIREAFSEIKSDYKEEKVLADLVKERWIKLKGIERRRAKQRLYGWLMRRGFSYEKILEAINQL